MGDPVDQLFEVRPDGFVAARNALARELRKAGDRDAASQVASMRRPSTAAWALNQVARQHPDTIACVMAAAQALRDATQHAFDGDASQLRDAQHDEQAALDQAVALGRAVLDEAAEPTTGVVVQRMRDTLRAAVTDPESVDDLRVGHLTRDLQVTGFGLEGFTMAAGAAAAAAPSSRARRPDKARGSARRGGGDGGSTTKDAAAPSTPSDRDRARIAQLDRRADEAAAALERLEEEAAAARAAATAAAQQATRAATDADRADQQVRKAKSRADAARDEADAARTRTRSAASTAS